ncbi:hypothetical protein ACHAXN_006272 [Cyclotella atomus]|jgi:hypothetical protein
MDHEDPSRNSDAFIKSQEAAARASASGEGAAVGAFAVAQAAPGGRRSGPRIRRTASQRRRARERAGLEPAGGAEGDAERGVENVEELMAADVQFDEMILEESEEEVLGFWQLDKTDKFICGGIAILVLGLIVILAMGMS